MKTRTEMTHEAVRSAVAIVAEHADAVLVLASFHEDGFTTSIKEGAGCVFSRRGLCDYYMQVQRQEDRNSLNQEDGDTDGIH